MIVYLLIYKTLHLLDLTISESGLSPEKVETYSFNSRKHSILEAFWTFFVVVKQFLFLADDF